MKIRLALARNGHLTLAATPLERGAPEPLRLALDDVPVDPADVFLFHKTTRRRRYEEARTRHPDHDDVVLVNIRGEATETSIANIAIEVNGRWWTPPLDAGLLPGTERAALLAEGSIAERAIAVEELRDAGGIAVFSSVRGWRRAVLLRHPRDREPDPPPGTRRVACAARRSDTRRAGSGEAPRRRGPFVRRMGSRPRASLQRRRSRSA